MKKDQVMKSVVLLQAVCMIVLAVVVVTHVIYPPRNAAPSGDDHDDSNKDPAPITDQTVATVGDEQITEDQLGDQLRSQYGETVLHTLMVRAAVRQEAKADGLQVSSTEIEEELAVMMAGYASEDEYYASMKDQLGLSPEAIREDTEYRLLLEKIATRQIDVSQQEIDDYIRDNPDEFAAHTQYRLSWIVMDSKEAADDMLDKLSHGEDFALMAKTYSTDANTADSGGDLGLIDEDDPFVDSGILEAAAKLDIGQTAGPIPVDDGEAIIRLTEKHTTEQMDEQRVRDMARKQVALSKADSLTDVENELLDQYNAKVLQSP